jgi:hypothetical protein
MDIYLFSTILSLFLQPVYPRVKRLITPVPLVWGTAVPEGCNFSTATPVPFFRSTQEATGQASSENLFLLANFFNRYKQWAC